MSYIYKLTLLRDTEHYREGQIYIGQTNGHNSGYKGSGTIIRAIKKKYGSAIFSKEIIVEGDFNKAFLNELEKHYVRLYAANLTGLNLTKGGDSPPQIKAKEVHQFSKEGEYLKTHESIIIAATNVGISNHMISNSIATRYLGGGFYWSFDRDENKIPFVNPRLCKVFRYGLDGEYIDTFPTILEASQEISRDSESLRVALDNERRKCGNYQFRSYKVDNCGVYTRPPAGRHVPVNMLGLDGSFIRQFKTTKEAAEATGLSLSKLCKVMYGKQKTAGGYKWEKVNN